MSNATAIAAVTGALCSLFNKIPAIQSALSDLKVTAVPPDQAGTDAGFTSLNVFLYQVAGNAAWRNMNVPRQLPAGSTASPPPDVPPAALDLNYIVTAYGKDNDDTLAHVAIAEVVSLLADNACLSPQLIQGAVVNTAITGIDLQRQSERVRVTPKPLTIEEISKLWTIFQAKYRISVSYQVSVVLIDSAQPVRAPLPVLTYALGTLAGPPPFPALLSITLPNGQPSARLGDAIVLTGLNLGGSSDTVAVSFQSSLLASPLPGTVTARSASQVTVSIPVAPTTWPAGPYLVSLSRDNPTPPGGGPARTRATNTLPMALAPRIVALTPPAAAGANAAIGVQASPEVWPGQQVSLLVGDAEITAPSITAQTDQLSFLVGDLPSGTYFVRLRVDGVDSLLADYTQSPPVFDTAQQVTLP